MAIQRCHNCGSEWGYVRNIDEATQALHPGIPNDFGADFLWIDDGNYFVCKKCKTRHPVVTVAPNQLRILEPE